MDTKNKLDRLKENLNYCKEVTKKGNYRPLYEKYYNKKLKENEARVKN